MIEWAQQFHDSFVLAPSLDGDGTLPGGGQPVGRLQKHGDAPLHFEANQAGSRKNCGVHASLLDLAQPRGNVAPQLDDLEIGTYGQQLRAAAKT